MSNIKSQSGEAQIPGTCAHSLFHPSPMVLVLLSATFPKLYYIVSLNPACSLATLGMRSKMRAKMTFFFSYPFSQYAGPKALTLSLRNSALFAFDSDMIIATLPGFKVIFYLSSEPEMFY